MLLPLAVGATPGNDGNRGDTSSACTCTLLSGMAPLVNGKGLLTWCSVTNAILTIQLPWLRYCEDQRGKKKPDGS